MIALITEGQPVLYDGKPYLPVRRSDPPGFWILRDREGNERLAHESNIEDSGLRADFRWDFSK
jgi:hypothetical protein